LTEKDVLAFLFPSEKNLSLDGKQNQVFKKICFMMKQEKHKNLSGLRKIINLAFKMNASGRRRYSKRDILNFATSQMKI